MEGFLFGLNRPKTLKIDDLFPIWQKATPALAGRGHVAMRQKAIMEFFWGCLMLDKGELIASINIPEKDRSYVIYGN